jgi:hypothetical protein
MTRTSGYSGKHGGRLSHYVSDQTQNARLPGYREAQKRIGTGAAADGPNETVHDDERQTAYGDHLG